MQTKSKKLHLLSDINSDIDKIIEPCATCQEHQKSQGAKTLMPHEIQVQPWQIMDTDIFNLKGCNYLLIVDFYSKYSFIHKLREFSSQEVIRLTKQIFVEQGKPERLMSDNGSHFSSLCFKEFAKEGGHSMTRVTSLKMEVLIKKR